MANAQRATAHRETAAKAAPKASRKPQRGREAAQGPLRLVGGARALQPALAVGAVGDAFEQEAERTADAVMAMRDRPAEKADGGAGIGASLMRVVQRAFGKGEPVTKKNDDDVKKPLQKAPTAGAVPDGAVPQDLEARIARMAAGGEALGQEARAFFEPRFGQDFGAVRIHAGNEAAGAAVALGARAFTVGQHIFFSGGEYAPASSSGRRLLAHELTHTIQQRPAAAQPRVQRAWFGDARAKVLETMRGWARELPPYELMTVLLGRDPITDKPMERSGRNIIHAALKLVPDGMKLFEELEKSGAVERTAKWFDGEIARLALTWDGIKKLFSSAFEALGAADILSPRKAWDKIKAVFAPTLARVAGFAASVGAKILEAVKKALLDKLGAWASQQRGFKLLSFAIGKNPVTGEVVARTPKGFVQAFLEIVPGGDAILANLEKAKAIDRAVAWLEPQIKLLDLSWEAIKALFARAWAALSAPELLNPVLLYQKVAAIFASPVARVVAFAQAVGRKVLELIFEGAMTIAGPMGRQVLGLVRKAGAAFNTIIDDPVGFAGHLVGAVKLGFQQFSKRIAEHLKGGIVDWLVGALGNAGLALPKVWDLRGVLSLVLQVLGITYAKMRLKLVKLIGEERVALLERGFAFLQRLVTEGPAAAWQQIAESIGSLWDQVIGGIERWAVTRIVTAAVVKLASLLNPAGAVIQAIIATYDTIAFFVERIKQIAALVESIVDSLASIAAGKIKEAADYVERSMARTIPVVLSFLARVIGLGDVGEAIKKVIATIQAKVDAGIDRAIAWVIEKGKALFGRKQDEPKPKPGEFPHKGFDEDPTHHHEITIRAIGRRYVPMVASAVPAPAEEFIAVVDADAGFDPKRKATYVGPAKAAASALRALVNAPDATHPDKQAPIAAAEVALADALRLLLLGVPPKDVEKYKLEGLVATYASMPKQVRDEFEPDHQPQASLLNYAVGTEFQGAKIFSGTRLEAMESNRSAQGVAINLHKSRHALGLTYKKAVPGPVKAAIDNMALNLGTTIPAKRGFILKELQEARDKDARQIQTIVRQKSSFADILPLKIAAPNTKDKLIDDITKQIIQGEDKIIGRSMDDLKLPV